MGGLGSFEIVKLYKEFSYIYNQGKNFHSQSVVLFFLPQEGIRKVGFTATKKLGSAVKRNRAKRRMRALFLSFHEQLQDGYYIFVAKPKIVDGDFPAIQKDFYQVLKRAKVIYRKK